MINPKVHIESMFWDTSTFDPNTDSDSSKPYWDTSTYSSSESHNSAHAIDMSHDDHSASPVTSLFQVLIITIIVIVIIIIIITSLL